MVTIHNNNEHNIWAIRIDGKVIAVFKDTDYPDLLERNKDGSLKHKPNLIIPNNSSSGMSVCKLTFGDKLEFNFSLYVKETAYSNYLGEDQMLVSPQIIIGKLWPTKQEI